MHENLSMILPAPINPTSVNTKPTSDSTSPVQSEPAVGFQQILFQKSLADNPVLKRNETKQEAGDDTSQKTAQLSVHPEWTFNPISATLAQVPGIGTIQVPLNPENQSSNSHSQTVKLNFNSIPVTVNPQSQSVNPQAGTTVSILNVNSTPVPENPEERSVLFNNQIKAVYSPLKIEVNQSSEGTSIKAITSPIAFHDDGGFKSSAGLISGEVSTPEKIPVAGHSPPGQSNSPPQETELIEKAGPRGNDLVIPGSIRSTEEAKTTETHREVSIPRTPNLWREYFRIPVNEITKGTANHHRSPNFIAADVISSVEFKPRNDSYMRTPVHEITRPPTHNQASRPEQSERVIAESRPIEQSGPKVNEALSANLASKSEMAHDNKPNADFIPKVVDKPNSNPQPKSTDRIILNDNPKSIKVEHLSDLKIQINSQSVDPARSTASNVQPHQASDSVVTEKVASEMKPANQGNSSEPKQPDNPQPNAEPKPIEGKATSDFTVKAVEHQVGSSKGSPVATQVNTTPGVISEIGGVTNAPLQPGGNSVSGTVLELKEPISILGNAPTRIASEIAEFPTEELPDGGKAILKVELKPPRLGRLNIEMVKTQSGIEVKLVVRTLFARELLNQRGSEIKSALQDLGIDIKKLEIVDLNQDRQDFNRQQNGLFSGGTPFEKGSREAHQGSARHQSTNIADEESENAPESSTFVDYRSMSMAQNVLDVMA